MIKCGIHQADAPSPLLFCVGLNPSAGSSQGASWLHFKSGTNISHLFCMDDIKLYAGNEQDINSLIHTTWLYSNDIQMSFGLDKCEWMVSKRDKMITTKGTTRRQHSTCSRHLQIPWDPTGKWKLWRGCKKFGHSQIPKEVLKNQLKGKNKIQIMSTYTLI